MRIGKKVRRIQHDIIINAYNGAREITSLPAYPIRFVKNADLQRLVDNGKTYYKILVKKYCQMHYRGQLLQSKVLVHAQIRNIEDQKLIMSEVQRSSDDRPGDGVTKNFISNSSISLV